MEPIVAIDPQGKELNVSEQIPVIGYVADPEINENTEIHGEGPEMNGKTLKFLLKNLKLTLNHLGKDLNVIKASLKHMMIGLILHLQRTTTMKQMLKSDPTYEGGGDDEEEESLSDSSLSDFPDWMFEDFEGPEDDDIFASRPPDHARKLFKTLRAFVKSNKKQRAYERQNEENERNRESEEWYSDVDEDDLQSRKGSDDEGGLILLFEGFLARCRPIIGLDVCFLKGMYKGQLLTAIGRDGNDNIFPIAIAYVEIEKQETWKWFLNLLLRDIGSADEKWWAFISDRQKGDDKFEVRHYMDNHIVYLNDRHWLWHVPVRATFVVMLLYSQLPQYVT
ncbi:hypothetical protein BUALT_Bualt10G0057900 [Buddleja alternifolia]|uniref:MULE transposase domain-containing protein n=1 Tax=Buddleja alternifolia TaxID=168488 RepID=A0AAV6WX53_9LAMI|nr:hypothetical protein BUALT_Bualt10G0057900 [Buddleja alternifolia]